MASCFGEPGIQRQDLHIMILVCQSVTRSLSILSKTDSAPVGLAAKVNQKLLQPFQHIIQSCTRGNERVYSRHKYDLLIIQLTEGNLKCHRQW